MSLPASIRMRNAVRDLLPMGVRRFLRRARTASQQGRLEIAHQRLALRAARTAWHSLALPGEQRFRCNLCGAHGSAAPERLGDREMATCQVCGSSLRHRALIAAL